MKIEPLFLRFANGRVTEQEVIEIFLKDTDDDKSKGIATKALEKPPVLDVFKRDFRSALDDLIDNGLSNQFINYVNSYMKPSLLEFVEGGNSSRIGEKRRVTLKEEDTPWVEAVICYNLCLYIKSFGLQTIKHCPVCQKFFSHKGKYAKYCSDQCKGKK